MKAADVAEVAELAVTRGLLVAFWGSLLAATLSLPAAADEPVAGTGGLRVLSATRVVEPPVIDGRLDDAAWQGAEAIRGLVQLEPEEGAAASEETVVRVLYDDQALYIGARLEDSAPVSSRLGRRGEDLESDWFQVWLDPHLDRQSGAGFWVNPANVQIDMVLYNDTWSDRSWDAVWASETTVDAGGWTVEMRIPYSQLRFPHRDEHVWGVNFGRRIQRRNEVSRLVHVPRTETGFVSRFARLEGIEGIRPARSLELVPYLLSRADRRQTVAPGDPFTSSTELDAAVGLDVKYRLSSSLTLTGTINPDFGQVEVDPAVLNLTQFELFFPEKRPFFTEGASSFRFGQGASNNNFGFNYFRPSFFYSRRIGRPPQGRATGRFVDAPTETTILGAAKLTGRTAGGWTIGLLDAVTRQESARFQNDDGAGRVAVEPATNYFVSRLTRDGEGGSRLGWLVTAVNRANHDDLESLPSAAYTAGFDGYRFFGDKDVIWEWFAGGSLLRGSPAAIGAAQRSPAHGYDRPDAGHVTFDPTRSSLAGWSAGTMVAKQTGKWRYNVKAESYSPGFDTNDVGFMQRADLLATHTALMYNDPEPKERTRYRSWWVAKYQNWNHDGDLLANGLAANGFLQLHSYWNLFGWGGALAERHDDRLTRGGPVAKLPALVYGGFGFGTDSRKKVSLEISLDNNRNAEGGYLHGLTASVRFKPASNVSFSIAPSYSRSRTSFQFVTAVDDPLATATFGRRYVFAEIDRESVELATRLDWTFSPRLSLQLYLQPFIASGAYHGFKELARPRSLDYPLYGVDIGTIAFDQAARRYRVDPDADGPAASFSFADPDFTFRSLRGSAVLRWELRPGSALYLVWNENRSDIARNGDLRVGRDLSAISSAPSDDVFLVKVSYWLAM